MFEVRREKEQTRKQMYDEYKRRAFSQNNIQPNKPLVFRNRPPTPKPRTRASRSVTQNNTQSNKPLVSKKVTFKKGIPKPRTRSARSVTQNNVQLNKPLVVRNMPKPRARSRAVTQNNTRLKFEQSNMPL